LEYLAEQVRVTAFLAATVAIVAAQNVFSSFSVDSHQRKAYSQQRKVYRWWQVPLEDIRNRSVILHQEEIVGRSTTRR
jgi:hypothetical protein